MQFFDLRDARNRISHSIVTLNKEPVYAHSVEERQNSPQYLRFKSLSDIRNPNSRFSGADLLNPKNKIRPIVSELGWMNSHNKKCALYLQRTPARTMNMGLNENNISIQGFSDSTVVYSDTGFSTIYTDPGFESMLNTSYPRFKTCLEFGWRNFCFSPFFAINFVSSSSGLLYNNIDWVGEYDIKSNEFLLYSCHGYLKEILEKTLGDKNYAVRVEV